MAGLIPRSFIDTLLDRVDIVEIVGQRVALKKTGHSFKACCPFHDEKTPSFNVNPDKQFFHCFGCGAGGNAISFLMDYENVDFPAAVEMLAAHLGLDVPREAATEANTVRKQESETLYQTLDWAARFYQRQLRESSQRKTAVSYLQNRGLKGEVARDFGIGYAPSGWDNLLRAGLQDSPSQPQQRVLQLEKAGLIIRRDSDRGAEDNQHTTSAKAFYDRFRERVMFPIRDNRGRVIAFGGRVLGDEKPKYLNSPETPVFHKQKELYGLYESRKANRQLDYLLLVEGYMDVVALFQYGITRAVATLGTASGIAHLEKIFRFTSKLVVCFDGDEAGQKAAQRLLEVALPVLKDGREVRFLFLDNGEDPDNAVRRVGKAAFERLIAEAQPLEDYMFERATQQIDLATQSGQARLSTLLLPMIKQIPPGIYQQGLVVRLAEQLHLSADVVREQLERTTLPKSHADRGAESRQPVSQAPARPVSGTAASVPKKASSPAFEPRAEPSDQAATTEEPGELHLRWAITTLVHYPSLAVDVTLPEGLRKLAVESGKPAPTLIVEIVELVAQRVEQTGSAPPTPSMIGHWHDHELEPLLMSCIGAERPMAESYEVAKQELRDIFDNWESLMQRHQQDQRFSSVGTENQRADSLTAEQIEYLKSLGKPS